MKLPSRIPAGAALVLVAVARPLSALPPAEAQPSGPPPVFRALAAPEPPAPPAGMPAAPEGFVFWKTVRAKVTAYCPCHLCCEPRPDGLTSLGDSAWTLDGVAVAPDAVPYRTRLWIPGAGWKEADDTGSAMRKAWKRGVCQVDLRMATHWAARQWGVKALEIPLYRPR